MDRRQFLNQAAFAFAALAVASPLADVARAENTLPTPSRRQAGYYWLTLGSTDIAALSDGTLTSKAKLLNDSHGIADTLLKEAYAPKDRIISVNAFLVLADDRRILIDAGTGTLLGPTLNKLSASLAGTGFTPEQITDILLTHVHADHSGGLTVNGKMVFPNATVRLNRVEAEFWLNPANMEKAKDYHKPMFVRARESLAPYLAAGRLAKFEAGQEVLPGITSIAAPGHTPGHTNYLLESQGEKLRFWGDTVHVAEAQFPHPEIAIEYDLDPDAAALQRQKIFAEVAAQGCLAAGAHISFPGIGHVGKSAQGYQWYPVPYINNARA
jgi:Zn-dependent hydrolases, including glyoxylases